MVENISNCEPLISIIMPVYNAEKYLDAAINSVLTQTYKNFELILVNDGSKDVSGNICEKYANEDPRVRYFRQENQGICKARNKGIEASRGDYITFCDNDDIYLTNFLEDNIKLILDENADLIKFGKKILYVEEEQELGEEVDHISELKPIYVQKDMQQNFSELERKGCFMFVWDGIYSRKLLESTGTIHKFDPWFKSGYEDFDFNYRLVKHINKLLINSQVYYAHYMRTSSSTSLKYSDNKLDALLKIMGMKDELIWNYYLAKDGREQDAYILEDIGEKASGVVSLLSADNCTLSNQEKKDYLKKITDLKSMQIEFTDTAQSVAREYNKSRFMIWKLLKGNNLGMLLTIGWLKKHVMDRLIKGKGYKIS